MYQKQCNVCGYIAPQIHGTYGPWEVFPISSKSCPGCLGKPQLAPRPTIYIAGPMTGQSLMNYPWFTVTAAKWRDKGWHVTNPSEMEPYNITGKWEYFMKRDIPLLLRCLYIGLHPNFQDSPGAMLEYSIAKQLSIEPMWANHPQDAKQFPYTLAQIPVREVCSP